MDQGSIGKLGNKVEDTRPTRSAGGEKQDGRADSSPSSVGGDTVNLTSGAQLLSRLQDSLAAAPAVDSAKVAEVKAAIASGNYEIDTSAIADAMLRFERALGD